MTKRSFASKLPKDLREELDRQIVDGRVTVDELWTWLRDRGVDVGRSSVHRHIQSVEEVAENMRQAREAASAIVQRLGDGAAEGQVGQLLIEVVQTIAFKIAQDKLKNPDGPQLDMEELMFLASAVQKLIGAQKTDTDRLLKVREEEKKLAAARAGDAAKKQGLGKDTVDFIVNHVLGKDS